MKYYFSVRIPGTIDNVRPTVEALLKEEGFGILTEIDVKETLKKKLDVDFPGYVILGACNPPFAYQALQREEKIGLMLPCNVILQQKDGEVEVSAIDPIASMAAVENPELEEVATQVREKLQAVINRLAERYPATA